MDCITCNGKDKYVTATEWMIKLNPPVSRSRLSAIIKILEKQGNAYKKGYMWMIKKGTLDPRKKPGRPKNEYDNE